MLVGLQYLRGLAALMVVYHHVTAQIVRGGGPKLPAEALGAAGVDLFFVISGFIMWVTTAQARSSPGQFLFRRATRVVPLYWAVTALVAGLTLVSPQWLGTARFEPLHITASFLFIPFMHPIAGEILPLYIQGWTINYEMFFYSVMAVCLCAPSKTRLGLLIGSLSVLALIGTSGLVEPSSTVLAFLTRPIVLEFGLGLLGGWLYLGAGRISPVLPMAAAAAGAALLVGTAFFGVRYGFTGADPSRLLLWGGPSGLIVTGLALWERDGGLVRAGALSVLGDASYSIYMTHIIVLSALSAAWRRLGLSFEDDALTYAFVAFASVCFAGIASYAAFERPLIRFFRNARRSFERGQDPRVVG